ncbi:calcium-binding protein [soil metagenome]
MAVTSSFTNGILSVFGDTLDNQILLSRDAAGLILVNGGAVSVPGGTPTVANTSLIQAFGLGGNDVITLSEANGALPAANLFGGAGNDILTGGSGADQLFGQGDNDVLLGKGGGDLLFGGDGNDTLTGGDGDDQMFGQAGDDRIIWNPGDDTDLAEGGDGTDTLEVNGGNGAEAFTILPNGTRVRLDRVTPAPFSIDAGTIEQIVINANGGDDSVTASNGLASLVRLIIDGGTGNDTISGGDGNDLFLGGDGNDLVAGGRGDDVALLGAGDDIFVWNPGDANDVVEGQDGFDTLDFNGANVSEHIDISVNGGRVRFTRDVANITQDINDVERVVFHARGGSDNVAVHDLSGTSVTQVTIDLAAIPGVAGGDGQSDTVRLDATNGADSVQIEGSSGFTAVFGLAPVIIGIDQSDSFDTLPVSGLGGDDIIDANGIAAGTMSLVLDGGDGNDTLNGSDGADQLQGGLDNDSLTGDSGADTLAGGDGNDTAAYVGSDSGVSIDLSINIAAGGDATGDTLSGIENITGSSFADSLIGEAGANILDGRGGGDVMQGLGGDDTYIVDNVQDSVLDGVGQGNDTVFSGVNYALSAGQSIEVLATFSQNGTAAINLTGNEFNQAINGNAGANILDGRGGGDVMHGLGGDDTYIVDNALDFVFDGVGQGNDAVFSSVNYTLSAGQSIEVLATLSQDGTAAINLTGNELSQTVTGNAGANILNGGDGADTLSGGAGNDQLRTGEGNDSASGGAGNDTILGGEGRDIMGGGSGKDQVNGQGGNDTLFGGAANDELIGGDGNDRLTGGDGNDNLNGGAGADTLEGGPGADVFTGGTGVDHFVFGSLGVLGRGAGNRDIITDFKHNTDRIDISDFDARTDQNGIQNFDFIGTDAFDSHGQVRAVQVGANTVLLFNTSGDLTPERDIVLSNVVATTLIDGDFIF